jgi:ferric-dicitrate binding protein FerR (iron transport regulator)
MRQRVHDAAEAAWRRSVAQRRARRRYAWLAAAGVVLAIAATLASLRPGADLSPARIAASPGPLLGTVAKIEGSVYLVRAGETRRLQVAGRGSSGGSGSDDNDDSDDSVRVGDTLRTGAGGRAALVLAGGLSLRLNNGTALTFRSPEQAAVEHGAVYVDAGLSGERRAFEPFELVTRFGSVSHVGTQYEVNVDDADLRVRVREGSVTIERGGRRIVGESGEQLTLPESGSPVRKAIATHGESWAWIDGLAAVEARDPYPVLSLLQWISRQTGRRLEFESPAVEARARALTLHGVEGLTPEEALDVVRATTALGCSARGDALRVTAAGEADTAAAAGASR